MVEDVSIEGVPSEGFRVGGGSRGCLRAGSRKSDLRGGSSSARAAAAIVLSAAAAALAGCTGEVTPFEEAIEVRDLELETLSIVPPLGARTGPLVMNPGDSVPFTLAGSGGDRDFVVPSTDRNWRVSDGRYATIDESGRLVALADGEFTVEVNVGDVVAQGFDVRVFDAAIQTLAIERAERDEVAPELDACIPAPYLAIGQFNDGSERLLLSDVDWDVVQGSGARVETLPDASAELIGTRPGEVTVTAAANGASGELTATVGDTLRDFQISSNESGILSRSVGNTLQLTAIGTYGSNDDVTRDVEVTDGVEWSVTSGDEFASVTTGIADETSAGLVSALSEGEAQISARCGQLADTVTFTASETTTSDNDDALNTLSFEGASEAGDAAGDGGTLELSLSQREGQGAFQLRVAEGSAYQTSADVTLRATWELVSSQPDDNVDDLQTQGVLVTDGQDVGQLDTEGLDQGQFLPLRQGTAQVRATLGPESATLTVRVIP